MHIPSLIERKRDGHVLADADIRALAADWASCQTALDLAPLRDGVVRALNAAFETAVPGSGQNPTPGQPQTSAGRSRLPKPSPTADGAGTTS